MQNRYEPSPLPPTHFAVVDKVEEQTERLFRACDFSVRVVDTNLPKREIGLSETYANEPKPRGKEIRVFDHPTDHEPAEYKAGQTFHCLLDITAGEALVDSTVEKISSGKLRGSRLRLPTVRPY
jgi:hypothetical protein